MITQPLSIELAGHGGDAVRAWLWRAAEDRADPPRGVVVAHDVFGPDTARATAAELARRGFSAILPDLYAREGLPGPAPSDDQPTPPWTRDAIRAAVASLPDRRAVADLDAAAKRLVDDGLAEDDRVGALGFCMGGTFAYLLGCTSTRIHAVVDFYGRIVYADLDERKPTQPLELALNLTAPFLGLFGEADASIPLEDVERLRTVLSQSAKDFDIVTFPGADHGFAHSQRGTFQAAAAADAWERAHAFLDERLG